MLRPIIFEELESRRVFSAVSFLSHPVATFSSRPHQIVSGDVNSDGRVDFVAIESSKLTWVENKGSNAQEGTQFASHLIDEIELQSIHLADLDSDGDLDIIAARQQDFGSTIEGRIFWVENLDGQGSFSGRQGIATSEWFWIGQLVATDLDGDNDTDVMIGAGGGLGGGSVLWLENDGNENFSGSRRVGGFETAILVEANDIDRDGDLDVLAAFGSDFPYLLLTWYQNNGNQQFSPREIQEFDPQPNNQSFPTGVVLADLDGDGDEDVISGLSAFVSVKMVLQQMFLVWVGTRILMDVASLLRVKSFAKRVNWLGAVVRRRRSGRGR